METKSDQITLRRQLNRINGGAEELTEEEKQPNKGRKCYVICPVREGNEEQSRRWVEKLEADGWEVYWPWRDTDQNSTNGGLSCMEQNYKGMYNAEVVFFIWDGNSKGSYIDVGMALGMTRPIIPLDYPEPESDQEKCLQNLVGYYYKDLKRTIKSMGLELPGDEFCCLND